MYTDKMGIANAYIKKMRRLMLWRIICIGAVTVIFCNMRKLPTGPALVLFGGFGIATAVFAILSTANMYCPFCGARFTGFATRRYEIIPDECPHCHERLKY